MVKEFTTQGRGKVYENFVDTIGDTPLVRLIRLRRKIMLLQMFMQN